MRLGYVDASSAHPHSLQWWARNGQDPDTAIHLVRTWAWTPWMQEMQQRLGHALHNQTPVPHQVKELAIVRVCSMVHSPYELFHHVPIARRSGLTADVVRAAGEPGGADDDTLSDLQRAVVRYTDEFDAGRGVQDDTFDAIAAHLTPAQIVGLSLQIGYWGCNARLTKATRAQTEPWITYTPEGPAPADPAVVEEGRAAEEGGRLGVPPIDAASERARAAFEIWNGRIPLLARTWAWVDAANVAEHRRWQTASSDHVELAWPRRALVARRVAWLRHSPYLLRLLAEHDEWGVLDASWSAAAEGDPDAVADVPAAERDLLRFVDAWENGLGVGDSVFARAFDAVGRRQLVEVQLIAGMVGTHSRLATALELPAPN